MAHNAEGVLAGLVVVACWWFPRIAAGLAVARLGLFGLMWTVDWSLADGRVLIEGPLIVATLVLLRRERRLAVIPALVCLYAAYFSRPAPPYFDDMLTHWLPVAVLLALVLVVRERFWAQIAVVVVPVLALVVTAALTSRLPDRVGHGSAHHGGVSIAQLTGPRDRAPDRSFTLTATAGPVTLGSGRVVDDGLLFNGQAPGPELRVVQGELVEVTLVNQLPGDMRATIHWHGLNVPNAEDGVAGVTQDAVAPGARHIYRFVAEQVGTFWYHTHQEPLRGIRRGLFGALIVAPRGQEPAPVDLVVMAHEWHTGDDIIPALGTDDRTRERQVAASSRVRLRLVNTDNNPADDVIARGFALIGVPFRVVAIDGVDVNGPTELHDVALRLATGGRYDLEFVMPDRPVRLADLSTSGLGLVLTPGSGAAPFAEGELDEFDPARYGTALPLPYQAFDREFTQLIDDRIGFFDGALHLMPTINGHSFPDAPPLVVRMGETVRVRIVNRSHQNHPMHLHGHTVLVLSRDGRPTTGSPWWTDSLDARPGEIFEVAFRADNPGVWMDHCHNLDHAANGMVMHLIYEGYTSPYESGRATINHPE